jgi:hypothetical protein
VLLANSQEDGSAEVAEIASLVLGIHEATATAWGSHLEQHLEFEIAADSPPRQSPSCD